MKARQKAAPTSWFPLGRGLPTPFLLLLYSR
jgi:hypothetical protein